ncbi:hypothetical protein O0L34_g3395 [Tuta absoluta]|nr:hypothetical protein O0L34_g3395 [Tuta absoluta]
MVDNTVLTAKVITMVILFTVSMLCGCLPLIISVKFDWFTKSAGPDMRTSNQFVLGLLAFGGGVLFATTFMHLLPEVDENVQLLQAAGQLPEMPIYLAALIMCSGFFMMYLVEELVHVYINSRENSNANTSFTRVLSIRRNNDGEVAKVFCMTTLKAALIMCSGFFMMYLVEELVHVYINSRENSNANTSFTRVLSIRRNNDGEVAKVFCMTTLKAALIMCSGFFMMYLVEELVHVYINSRENSNANTSFTRVLSIRRNNDGEVAKDEESKSPDHKGHVHGHSHLHTEGADDSIVAALRGLLIVLALSIHELFEGLAVGLESSANKVWFMFGAVSAHKYIIAFCIGVELLVAGTRRWLSILYIFTFSFVSALGIGVGILLVGGAGAAQAGLYSVVLQGLACGTLVYVVFFEVWRQDRTGLLQFVCSVLGFALMVALELVVELAA